MKQALFVVLLLSLSANLHAQDLQKLYDESFTFDQVAKQKWVLESENAYGIDQSGFRTVINTHPEGG